MIEQKPTRRTSPDPRYKANRSHYGNKPPVYKPTETTFLPACVVCRSYPAHKIAGEWKCDRHG